MPSPKTVSFSGFDELVRVPSDYLDAAPPVAEETSRARAFERTRATTEWPFDRASRTISRPVPPVAPKTRTFMFDLDLH
jgi:hypothetical protein